MDPLANMLTAIRNAYMVNKPYVGVPYSTFKWQIAKVLQREKFVGEVTKNDKQIEINLVYEGKLPKIKTIKQISKQGLRIYSKAKQLKNIKGGRGILILSTPGGVMTNKDAKAKNLGGEVICEVW